MLKTKGVLLIVVAGLTGNLTGCGTVATYFPDKERDYQHTQEIPMLNWPKELRTPPEPTPSVTTPSAPTITSTDTSSASSPTPATAAASNTTSTTPTTEAAATSAAPTTPDNATPVVAEPYDIASEIPAQAKPPSEKDPVPDDTGDTSKPVVVEQIKRDGSSRLRINVAMLRAWRAIDKALSRNAIEVTERSPEEHRYTVQYDPNEKKPQDGSLLDEIHFMFNGFEINAKSYQLQLVPADDYIEVQIVDDKQKPIADSVESIRLLDTLEKTIKADFAEAQK